MTIPLPSYVKTGLVAGKSIVVDVDTVADADFEPDASYPVGSELLFTPTVAYLVFTNDHATTYLQAITAQINSSGDPVTVNGDPLRLVANLGQTDNDQDWYWTVRPKINGRVQPTFRLDVTAGATNYLSDAQPIPAATASASVARGAPGAAGAGAPPAGTPDNYVAASSSGSAEWVDPATVGLVKQGAPISIQQATSQASAHALTAYLSADGAVPQVAANLVSDNTADSCVYVTSKALARGAVKITHIRPTGLDDSSGSGISIDLRGDGSGQTAAMGLFIDSTVGGGTTGNLLSLRNGNPSHNNLFAVDRYGQLVLDNDSLGMPAPSGTQAKIANDGNGELWAVSADRTSALTVRVMGSDPKTAHGMLGYSFDPACATTTSVPTLGTSYATRLRVPKGAAFSSVRVYVTSAGVGCTMYAAVYSTSGAQLGVSAGIASQPVGELVIPVSGTADHGEVYVEFICVGGTAPTLARGAGSGVVNVGRTSANYRFAADGSGLSAPPATLGALGASSTAWWVGLA